jgi:uncharacterized hydrophobic protein (TIGR00271 family)
MAEKPENILSIGRIDQYRTVEDLVKKSQPSSSFYTLLVLSSVIVTSGLLLGNTSITIGGMLITPVLTPLLLIGLGLSIGEPATIKRAAILTVKSFFIVLVGSFFLSLLFGSSVESNILDNSFRVAFLYFVVAFASGIAATFGWTRKSIAEVLPGIAIAVSLLPPMSWVGIGLSRLNFEIVQFNLTLLVFNLAGILAGSIIAFSLLKFYRVEKKVEQETEEVEKEIKKKAKEKEEGKYEKL